MNPPGRQSTVEQTSAMPEQKPTKGNAWQNASEGMQLTVTLLLGVYAGYKLDQYKGTTPWFMLAGAALGLGIGLYNFLRRFLKKP